MQRPLRPLPAEDLSHAIERAEAGWRALRGASLLVTGGTGFFGKWLLEALAAANDRLALGLRTCVLARDPAAFRARAPHLEAAGFDWLPGDVREFAVARDRFTHVIHAAASSDAALYRERPDAMREVIVRGTQRVLEMAPRAEILFVSSGAVYGRQPPELARLPESFVAPLAAQAPYEAGKREAEALCARSGSAVRVARCFAFVGPHLPLDAHFAAGNFLGDALAGRPIRVGGDGSPRRSYLHMADLVAWLVTILTRGASHRPYNVGSDHDLSIAELARRVAALREPALEVRIALPPRETAPERYVPDVSRARNELGLETWIGLDQALRRTFDWLRSA